MRKPTSDCWIWRHKPTRPRVFGRESSISRKVAHIRHEKLLKNFGASVQYVVRLSDRALRDLADIYEFVEVYASDLAMAWFRELETTLSREPSKRRQLFFGRKLSIYKIIYAVDRRGAEVKVFHVSHGRAALCQHSMTFKARPPRDVSL
jgi:plasmid stabilization system protein ParE